MPTILIEENGHKYWRLDHPFGVYHREDGPAIELSDGTKYWYINGELHRENGPAIERADGYTTWHLDGYMYTKEEYKNEMISRKLNRI